MSARIKELEEEVWFHNVNVNYEPRMCTSSKLPLSNKRRESVKANTFWARCERNSDFPLQHIPSCSLGSDQHRAFVNKRNKSFLS